MKRNLAFTLVAAAMALCLAGCGCAAATPAGSPSWSQLQSAKIPSVCGHPPTKLVNGKHTGIAPGQGSLQLRRTLTGGKSGVIAGVPSSAGRLTAVVAMCNHGGVGMPSEILFFGPGPKLYAATNLLEGRWDRAGFEGPARDGVTSMSVTADGLALNVDAYRRLDALCCSTGKSAVNLKIGGGRATITRLVAK